MDNVVIASCCFAAGFLIGIWAGDTHSEIYLKPCPQQTGYAQISSSYSDKDGLVCNYRPVAPDYPRKRKA